MSCYVADDFGPGKALLTTYLAADSVEELDDAALDLFLMRNRRRFEGTLLDHFLLTQVQRDKAIARGAVALTTQDLSEKLRSRSVDDYSKPLEREDDWLYTGVGRSPRPSPEPPEHDWNMSEKPIPRTELSTKDE